MSFVKCRRLEYLQGGAVTRSPLLTAAACERIRELADADAAARGGWGSGADYAYATRDLEVDAAPSLAHFLREIGFVGEIRARVAWAHGLDVTSFDDVFVVKYSADAQRALVAHQDAGDVSFMVALSDRSDYVGGGTRFEDRDVVHCDAGRVLTFLAALSHRGVAISRGCRYLLVGFCKVGAAPAPGDVGLDLRVHRPRVERAPAPVARCWTAAVDAAPAVQEDAALFVGRGKFVLAGEPRCALEALVAAVVDFHAAQASAAAACRGVFWVSAGPADCPPGRPRPLCSTATFLRAGGPAIAVRGDDQTFVALPAAGAHVAWPGGVPAGAPRATVFRDDDRGGLRLHVDVFRADRAPADVAPAPPADVARASTARAAFRGGDADATASLYVADEPDGALRHLEAQQARKDGGLACVLLGPWRGLADDDDADVSPATKRRRRT